MSHGTVQSKYELLTKQKGYVLYVTLLNLLSYRNVNIFDLKLLSIACPTSFVSDTVRQAASKHNSNELNQSDSQPSELDDFDVFTPECIESCLASGVIRLAYVTSIACNFARTTGSWERISRIIHGSFVTAAFELENWFYD